MEQYATMSTPDLESSNLLALARRLEGDIRARGLREGDRYLTSNNAGFMLGVSGATAHRAMNLLVKAKLLTRRHGRGTFVGPAIGSGEAGADAAPRVRTVYVLLPDDQRGMASIQLEDIVEAMRSRLGDVNVQFSYVPGINCVAYVRELIAAAQRAGHYAGAVAISCPRDVYRYLSEVGGPVVVIGSLYPDQRNLASVDPDHYRAGELLAGHLIDKGHQRMALVTSGAGRPGDNAFLDGISAALTGAQLPHNAMVIRLVSHDFSAFRAQVHELLDRPDRPTGIICGGARLLGAVVSAATDLELTIPRDLDVVFQGSGATAEDALPYPHSQPKLTFREIAEGVADTLERLAEGEVLTQYRTVIPVVLRGGGGE